MVDLFSKRNAYCKTHRHSSGFKCVISFHRQHLYLRINTFTNYVLNFLFPIVIDIHSCCFCHSIFPISFIHIHCKLLWKLQIFCPKYCTWKWVWQYELSRYLRDVFIFGNFCIPIWQRKWNEITNKFRLIGKIFSYCKQIIF